MKIYNILLVGALLFNYSGNAVAEQTVTQNLELEQLQLKYQNLLESIEENNALDKRSMTKKYAEPTYLPSSPGSPNSKFEVDDTYDNFSLTFWRARVGNEDNVPLIRIEDVRDAGQFICSSSFTVIQNGKQFDDIVLRAEDDSSYCATLFVDKTFILDQRTSNSENEFDDKAAFSIIFDFIEATRFEIPALSGGGNTPAPSNESAIIDENLNIYMPSVFFGTTSIWIDLEYQGTDSNAKHIWQLKNVGVN